MSDLFQSMAFSPAVLWPLACLLVALLALRQVREDTRPVVRAVSAGLAQHAQRYALAYAMATLYGAAASLQALAEVAQQLGWVHVAAAAKVIQPGAVAVIAYVSRSPAGGKEGGA